MRYVFLHSVSIASRRFYGYLILFIPAAERSPIPGKGYCDMFRIHQPLCAVGRLDIDTRLVISWRYVAMSYLGDSLCPGR